MIALREFVKVENHQLHIQLPNDFNYEEVEVVILPKECEKEVTKKFDFSPFKIDAFEQCDAVAYQRSIRDEWE